MIKGVYLYLPDIEKAKTIGSTTEGPETLLKGFEEYYQAFKERVQKQRVGRLAQPYLNHQG